MSGGSTPSPSNRRQPAGERLDALLRERLFGRAPHIGVIRIGEDLIHYVVALVLLAVAGIVLFRSAYDLATSNQAFAAAATTALNGVLFAIIVLEVMRTVIAHFERGGLQLQPFLIIGSSVRSGEYSRLAPAYHSRAPRRPVERYTTRCSSSVSMPRSLSVWRCPWS